MAKDDQKGHVLPQLVVIIFILSVAAYEHDEAVYVQ